MYLHQIWFDIGNGSKPPYPSRRAIMCATNPELEYRLWSLLDAQCIIEQHYPQYIDVWKSLPHGINRADFFRYILMHRLGGCYFDIDFVCCRPLQPFLKGNTVVLGEEWPHSVRDATVHNGALVSGSPLHPFWIDVMQEICDRLRVLGQKETEEIQKSVFQLTGTALLRDVLLRYWGKSQKSIFHVILAPFFTFCPIVAHGGLVTSYTAFGSNGSWMYPQETQRGRLFKYAHVFTFIAPAYKTWQTHFTCKANAE